MVDLIRDGARPADLRTGGDRAVWNALLRTACSAVQRGWDCWEWQELVLDPKSHLGVQVRLKGGQKPRSKETVARTLEDAWDKATAWVSEQPQAFDRAGMAELAQEKATALLVLASDPDADLPDVDRAVLAYAADQARTRGLDRIPMPRADVVKVTGFGERAVRNALTRLTKRGLLLLAKPGRQGAPGAAAPRAGLYRLPTAAVSHQYRETRSMGPPHQIYGTPAVDPLGTPHQIYGTPPVPTRPTDQEGTGMAVTLTITAANPDALAAALDALRRETGVHVEASTTDEAPLPANVTPLRRRAGRTPA